ncbi:MAG: acyltransferase [Sphingomonas sp.]|nr:acyltransferase [Sphingomonas sp.]
MGDRSSLGMGTNVRAAGGTIRMGAGSTVAQYGVLVAANHVVRPGEPRFHVRWDEERHGIEIGSNVWVGAHCVILPGSVIGDDAVIAAGSVVRGTVPPGEIWGGVPARKIKSIGEA